MPAVTFDKLNRELRTVRFYFRDAQEAVVKIHYKLGISSGATIQAGDLSSGDANYDRLDADIVPGLDHGREV